MELSESESVLILIRDLAKQGKLDEIVVTLRGAFEISPHIEPHVRAIVPAVMLNNYFYPKYSSELLEKWKNANPDWAKSLSDNVTDRARFSLAITLMEESIKRI